MTHKEAVEYKLTLKALTDEQLFEAWSQEYDAGSGHADRVQLIIAEMDSRKLSDEVIKL